MEGHPVDPGRVLAEGRSGAFQKPKCRTNNAEIYLPDQEWPEEPEAYEEFPKPGNSRTMGRGSSGFH